MPNTETAGAGAKPERTPQDYAIEHAEYMAQDAERLLDTINHINARRDEDGDAFDSDALRLADEVRPSMPHDVLKLWAADARDTIRRQHAENETLRAGYAAARLEIESLKAQLAAPADVAVADEIGRLRAALVYVAFALHDTRQYMLAEGITLIDGDTVRVSRDGWTVEATTNPLRQPAPQQEPILYDPKALLEVFQTAQAGSSGTAGTLRGIAAVIASWESRPEPHAWLIAAPQSSPAAQGDALDAARYRWLRERSSTMFVNISINGEGAEIAATLDSAVDAARAAQEGANHG